MEIAPPSSLVELVDLRFILVSVFYFHGGLLPTVLDHLWADTCRYSKQLSDFLSRPELLEALYFSCTCVPFTFSTSAKFHREMVHPEMIFCFPVHICTPRHAHTDLHTPSTTQIGHRYTQIHT